MSGGLTIIDRCFADIVYLYDCACAWFSCCVLALVLYRCASSGSGLVSLCLLQYNHTAADICAVPLDDLFSLGGHSD